MPYKTTQVQLTEDGGHMRRMHFCNWFLWAVHDSVSRITDTEMRCYRKMVGKQKETE
jgi:hypothetical protein